MIHLRKFLTIISIIALINACERKNELPDKTQTDIIIPDLSIMDENIFLEEEIHEPTPFISINEPYVGIILRYESGNDRIVYVDRNVTELRIFKTLTTNIEGLNQLEFLDTIAFSMASHLKNFSFLTEISNLKRLRIENFNANIDWQFLEQLPDLEVLSVISYNQPVVVIDLKSNNRLEYIGFTSGGLGSFPVLNNVPNSLRYLNLENNRITSLPGDFDKYNQTTVFLRVNPINIGTITPDNVTTEWASSVLDQKYRSFSNTVDISDL